MEPTQSELSRKRELAEERVTGKIIACFYRVADLLERASTLDVGLLLHFGPSAKFHRLVSPRLLNQERREQ